MGMNKKKTKSQEELLKEALVPVEEQPYEVPKNWVWFKTGHCITIERGITFPGSAKNYTPKYGLIGCARTSNIQEEFIWDDMIYVNSDYYKGNINKLVKEEDILMSAANSYHLVGKVSYIHELKEQITFGGFLLCIRTNTVNSKYLYYFLKNQFILGIFRKLSSQTTNIANINAAKIESLPFPVPPENEQKRIVDKVEKLLGKINQAKKLIEEAKATFELRRAAILDKAFRGELTKKWRDNQEYLKPGNIYLEEINELKLKRYKLDCDEALELGVKKPQKIKSISVVNSTADFELPDNWITCSLGEIVYDFRYGTSSKSDYNYEGVPVLRIPNIGNEHITVEDIKYLRENQVERSNTVSEGDLLIIRSNGSKDLVGKCALVNKNCEGYAFASYLIRLRPIGVFPEYVYYLLRSENVRKQFFNKAKSSAGISNINTVELSATNIPLPSYEEQIQIVEVIKHLFSIEDEVLNRINTKDLLSSLSESVLSKAFRGELGTSNIEEENPEFLL